MKKAAIMVYPMFCMQEISCLTELFKFAGKEICVFASSLEPVRSEDGFTILPDQTVDEFILDDYDCIILPGIWSPISVAEDEKIISFLSQFQEDNLLLAAISSAPILLAKAKLLNNHSFCHGLFEECFDEFDYLSAVRHNVVRKPLVLDGNIITAIGFAFREFAVAVFHALHMPCPDKIFSGITHEYKEEELTFYAMSDDEMFADLREKPELQVESGIKSK